MSSGYSVAQRPLSELTTFGIGAVAEVVTVEDEQCLPELLAQPYRFLGKGANILADDRPLDEKVLCLGQSFKKYEITEDGATALLQVGGAFDLAVLVARMARAGWSGLEGLAGVPASLGGALRMNAGTAHRWLHDCVERVCVLLPGEQTTRWLDKHAYQAVYRDGGLPAGTWYLRAELLLRRGQPAELQAEAARLKAQKAASQPLSAASAGCIFKNPSKENPAGKLLDQYGCKGWQCGAAEVSSQHANFIVNNGGALAADVVHLIQRCRRHIWQATEIILQCEVQRWLHEDPLDCHPADIGGDE